MDALNRIQKELKAPKGQHNSFGNYNYRSCEDILEALKPLLGKATLTLHDDIVLIGDRYYVKATATLNDGEKFVAVSAFARECLDRKGMDASQITGATSSYARKYALNGLFCIDDTKDADHSNEPQKMPETAIPAPIKATPPPFLKPDEGSNNSSIQAKYLISEKQTKMIYAKWKAKNIPDETMKSYLLETYGISKTSAILRDWMDDILAWIDKQ